MKLPLTRRRTLAILAALLMLGGLGALLFFIRQSSDLTRPLAFVETIGGEAGGFGEPFGVAVLNDEIYVSDGEAGTIFVIRNGVAEVFASGLATPSAIAFDAEGNLIVADTGDHTIKRVDRSANVTVLAGVSRQSGFVDGEATAALFNGPIGIAIDEKGRIFVADTYNDRIRLIENGVVSTVAGATRGFGDGLSSDAFFDTPCGVTVWRDKLLVADSGNRRIRVVEPDGRVWTLAGSGEDDLKDGLLQAASFVQPMAITVADSGIIYVADGNAIRQIGGDIIPTIKTISNGRRGFSDGQLAGSRFSRPSGLAIDESGALVVADSDNRLVRKIVSDDRRATAKRVAASVPVTSAETFRGLQPPRWPFDPPKLKRDIAGTLGEIRGEITESDEPVWFHNGLDIAGSYGEIARFIRDEKVLDALAADNFGTLRELIRMPTLGYVHIRLGRDVESKPFDDARFLFDRDSGGKLVGVRVPRGSSFRAGEAIGSLNAMNHVHLVAGPSGREMNALAALELPGLTDSRPPVIEKVTVTDQNWREIETEGKDRRIKLRSNVRIIVRAYDQMDGNSERRRLGVYRLGYQILPRDSEPRWTISFDRMPDNRAVRFVYAGGSKSGATGETVFDYIVTNHLTGDRHREGFLDVSDLDGGTYTVRVFAADYHGNISTRDLTLRF